MTTTILPPPPPRPRPLLTFQSISEDTGVAYPKFSQHL